MAGPAARDDGRGSGRGAAQQRRAEGTGRAAPVEGGGTAGVGYALGARGLDEPLGVDDLAVEVAGIERGVPDDFVDRAQVADGEGGTAEGGGQGGVLQPGAGALDGVVEDIGVVEGQGGADFVSRGPAGAPGV